MSVRVRPCASKMNISVSRGDSFLSMATVWQRLVMIWETCLPESEAALPAADGAWAFALCAACPAPSEAEVPDADSSWPASNHSLCIAATVRAYTITSTMTPLTIVPLPSRNTHTIEHAA